MSVLRGEWNCRQTLPRDQPAVVGCPRSFVRACSRHRGYPVEMLWISLAAIAAMEKLWISVTFASYHVSLALLNHLEPRL